MGCGEPIPWHRTCGHPPSRPGLPLLAEEDGVNEKPKGRHVSRKRENQHLLGQPGEEVSGAECGGAEGCTPPFRRAPACTSVPPAKHRGQRASEGCCSRGGVRS